MKRISLIIVLLITLLLTACKEEIQTNITATIEDINISYNSVSFDVNIVDPDQEITGEVVVYLYTDAGSLRTQKTLTENTETITFSSIEPNTVFTIRVIATAGRDAIEVKRVKITTLEETAVVIRTPEDFFAMTNNRSGRFELGQDIDFTDVEFESPFGTAARGFSGEFDGKGHTLKNITFNKITQYTAVFGYLTSGKIKDLTLENITIGTEDDPLSMSTSTRVGVVYAHSTSEASLVEDVTVKNASIVFQSSSTLKVTVGGIAGESRGSIKNVSFIDSLIRVTTTSSADVQIGGIVGLQTNTSKLKQAYTNADVYFTALGTSPRNDSINHVIGGVTGQLADGGTLSELINEGNLHLDIKYPTRDATTKATYTLFAGGLIGKANSRVLDGYFSGNLTLSHDHDQSDENIYKQFRVGGLIGFYEKNIAATRLVYLNGTMTFMLSDDVHHELSQTIGFDRFKATSNSGVYGTKHLTLNDVSIVDQDDVNEILDLTDYFNSEWINSYLE